MSRSFEFTPGGSIKRFARFFRPRWIVIENVVHISGVTWHTLCHTFASRLLDQGVDILTVKELLGHSTVLVTMRYLHPNLVSKVQAVAKLAADCDNSVTVRPKLQQLIPKVSQIGR